jgi:hypothetical protein
MLADGRYSPASMCRRSLPIGVLLAATLLWAAPDRPAAASAPDPIIPSYSVSAKTRTVKRGGQRLLVVTSVTVMGVDRSVGLAIRCEACRRVRRAKIIRRTKATTRKYIGMHWLLPRGRGISVDATDTGKLGRWTVLGPDRRNPGRLVFKASGCLRKVTRANRRRPRRVGCPAGTVTPPNNSPVPVIPRPAPPAPAPPPPAAPAPPFQVCCTYTLEAAANQALVSPDGRYELRMQSDGNLVLYYRPTYHALWSTQTNGSGATRAVMQSDGNLVVYRVDTPLWQSHTSGYTGATLIMQNDGNAVIYHNGVARWSTQTSGRT